MRKLFRETFCLVRMRLGLGITIFIGRDKMNFYYKYGNYFTIQKAVSFMLL